MKTFLNEEKKEFKDLSDEEMIAVIRAKLSGNCEVMTLIGVWENVNFYGFNFSCIYRTKPKQLVIPWAVLKKNIKHAAMDKDGRVFGYLEMGEKGDENWNGSEPKSLTALDLDTDGVDWKTSLVTRPEGI